MRQFHFFWALAAGTIIGLTGCSHPAAPASASQAAGSSLTRTAGETVVTLTSGASMHTGDNTLTITLADTATGRPVGNANITATPEMLSPRLQGTSTTGRSQGNGLYTIPVRLAIASPYNVVLKIDRPGTTAGEASFRVEASQ